MTKRPVPLLVPDAWLVIIKFLEQDIKHTTSISDLYVFGRAAYTAVQRYVQSIFKIDPYPFVSSVIRYGKTRIVAERLVQIAKGKYLKGHNVKVTIEHPKLTAPIRKVVTFARYIFIDTETDSVFELSGDGTLSRNIFSNCYSWIKTSTDIPRV
jgi:hypothetical protein